MGGIQKFPVGEWQVVQFVPSQEGAQWIADDLAVHLEPPVRNGWIGQAYTIGATHQCVHQVQRCILAFAEAQAVNTLPVDHLGEEGRMRTTKD